MLIDSLCDDAEEAAFHSNLSIESAAAAHGEIRDARRTLKADAHVGGKIRQRRLMLGLSQQQLANMLSITYQQAHKYERGMNRVSAGRLFEIAEALAVPVSWFFEGLDMTLQHQQSPGQRRSLELARNFAAIDNEKHQDALAEMARVLAGQSLARQKRPISL